MDVTIGIDIGGSNTKLVAVDTHGKLLKSALVDVTCRNLDEQVTALTENEYTIGSIAITGVGAYMVVGDILGITPYRSHEFTAIGLGGLTVSRLNEAIIVSIGTGTAYIHAKTGEYRHIIGTGLGGGTLLGLSGKLLGTQDFFEIEALAKTGDLGKVDLTIGETTQGTLPSLDPNLTASNLASIKTNAAASDLALGVINMVLQAVGTMSILAAKSVGINNIVLTGALSGAWFAAPVYQLFQSVYGYNFTIPENSIYSTAIGAALDCMENKA